MPAVTTMSSAAQATPRAWRRWSAISSRSAATPNGGGDSDGISSAAACRQAARHARVSMRVVDGRPGSRSMRGRVGGSATVALGASGACTAAGRRPPSASGRTSSATRVGAPCRISR